MAGDQNSVCFPGGAAFPSPATQPLHHCHSAASLYSSLPISCGGPTFLPPGGAALSALQYELLAETTYDLRENSGDGRDSYALGWGVPGYSASAPFNGFTASSGVGSSMMATDVAGFSPLVGGAVRCDSTVDPLCSTIGSSMLPLEGEGFSPFVEGAIPCDSTAGQFNGPLLSSSGGGAASFCPSGYQETVPYSSAASFTESPTICSNEPTALQFDAASYHQSSEKGLFCYSTSTAPIDKPPAISSNGQMVPHMAPAAEASPSQAEPSERNDLDLSIIWTADEQHQLNEQLKRYLNLLDLHAQNLFIPQSIQNLWFWYDRQDIGICS